MRPLTVERRSAPNAAERRSGSLPVVPGSGLPSPSSLPTIDTNLPMGKLRTILGDGFVDNFGTALLLFETPSGFAIFRLFALYLYEPDAIESLWANFTMFERARHIVYLKEFETFDDKSSAINVDTGVNRQLTEMIMKWYCPGLTLVVGNEQYKSVIESCLEIPCLYDGIVMELMWGMQHLMHTLVTGEKSELRKEDRVPMSQGLQMFLSRYGYHVKPEMMNERIVLTASSLFHCDAVEKKEYPAFFRIGSLLKDLSGIDYKYWDSLKLAAAFNIILTRKINKFDEMLFTKDEKSKLLKDPDNYKGKVNEAACFMAYKRLVSAYKRMVQDKAEMGNLIVEAHEALSKLRKTHEKTIKPSAPTAVAEPSCS